MNRRKRKTYVGPCPIAMAMEVFGGKWKAAILFHLNQQQVLRFGELNRRIPEVTQRILALQLKELERDGLVRRVEFDELPPRVEYSATALASSLKDVLAVIDNWTQTSAAQIHRARQLYDERHEIS